MKVEEVNRQFWNNRVLDGSSSYTQPVSSEEVQKAKEGEWSIRVAPVKAVPKAWLGDVTGVDLLCLASGGGQQAPILAAAGANVTVLDISDEQLNQDKFVADRDGLTIRTVQGEMTDLSMFEADSFDLIVHPVANCFIPDVCPLWREAFRVLRPEGKLIAGMVNPLLYALDDDAEETEQRLVIKRTIPYSDSARLDEKDYERHLSEGYAFEFGHSLDDLIGEQLEAGFVLSGFYEGKFPGKPVDEYIATTFTTCAVKPSANS